MDLSAADLRRRLKDSTSENDIIRVFEEIREVQARTEAKLDQTMTSGQVSLNQALAKVEHSQNQLAPALKTSHELSGMLNSTASVAFRISSRIRGINAEHIRVKEALNYVENIIELKTCVIGIQDAMAVRDWERAASYVNKVNSLPKSQVDGQFARSTVPTSEIPDYPVETVQKVTKSLVELFIRHFNKATSTKDMENVTRYFKLFPLIGQENEGLDLYAKFISGIITAQSRTLLQHRSTREQSTSNGSDIFYALAMSRLFENIATIVSQHAPVVEKHYGKGKMARVLERIQDEADSQGGLIIDTFWDERRIDRILNDISQYSYPFLLHTFAPNDVRNTDESTRNSEDEGNLNLREVGLLVQEASIMLHRWCLYKKFLASRWDVYGPNAIIGDRDHELDQNSSSNLSVPNILVGCGFSNKVEHRVAPGFESLATFVFRRSIEKAFQLEELPDLHQKYTNETPLVTSVVDDVMYIYNTLLKQTVVTGDLTIISTVFANFRRILESDFIGIVQRKLRDQAPRQGMVPPARSNTPVGGRKGVAGKQGKYKTLASLSDADDKKLRAFLIYLNDLVVTPNYAEKIFQSLTIYEDVPFDDDAKHVTNLITAMNNGLKSRCIELLSDGISVTFYVVLSNRLRSLVTTLFNKANYMVSPDSGHNTHEMSQQFSFGWHSLIDEFEEVMAPENYTRLVTLAATTLSQIFEKWLWGLTYKVNELGAIALDRDISKIISTVSEGRYQLREKFIRVAQIMMIVGLDDEDSDDEDIVWSLNLEERERAKKIRV